MVTFVLFSFHYPNTVPSSGEHRLSQTISPDNENVLKDEPWRKLCVVDFLSGLVKVLLPLLNFYKSKVSPSLYYKKYSYMQLYRKLRKKGFHFLETTGHRIFKVLTLPCQYNKWMYFTLWFFFSPSYYVKITCLCPDARIISLFWPDSVYSASFCRWNCLSLQLERRLDCWTLKSRILLIQISVF